MHPLQHGNTILVHEVIVQWSLIISMEDSTEKELLTMIMCFFNTILVNPLFDVGVMEGDHDFPIVEISHRWVLHDINTTWGLPVHECCNVPFVRKRCVMELFHVVKKKQRTRGTSIFNCNCNGDFGYSSDIIINEHQWKHSFGSCMSSCEHLQL